MSEVVSCPSCGYITNASDQFCSRCNAALSGVAPAEVEGDVGSEEVGYSALPPPTPYGEPVKAKGEWTFPIPPLLLFIIGAVVIGVGAFLFLWLSGGSEPAKKDDKGALKAVLSSQPTYQALCEGSEGGYKYSGRVVNKGQTFAIEIEIPRSMFYDSSSFSGMTKAWIIATRGKDVKLVSPELEVVVSVPATSKDYPVSPWSAIDKLMGDQKVTVRIDGTSELNGFKVKVFRILDQKTLSGATVYVAEKPANAIVGIDVDDDWTSSQGPITLRLRELTTTIDESLLRVPATYTQINTGKGKGKGKGR